MENIPVKKRGWRSRAEIEQLLRAFERSGMTQQEFCSQNELSASTFSNWRRRASTSEAATSVLRPVHVSAVQAIPKVAVRLADGTEVFFSSDCNCEEIAVVVSALSGSARC